MSTRNEWVYRELLDMVYLEGERVKNRTGIDSFAIFGTHSRYDLRKGFPVVTSKKLFFKGVRAELLWFLRGDTNIEFLHEHDVHIWDAWANEDGELGPIYGNQWREWTEYSPRYTTDMVSSYLVRKNIDQVATVIESIKTNPDSRRHIVSAWNVADLDKMALQPCHILFQFNVYDGWLDLCMYQRSADMFLGVPFNIASYSLLLSMVAQVCGLKPRYFIHNIGDAHIYENHIDQVEEQLGRGMFDAPELWLNPDIDDIDKFTMDDIKLVGYNSHSAIKAPIAV